MAEPFVGEIKMFAGNFAPRGYAFCDGQLLAVSQNDALFSLLGTTYGGDGRTTFALPDLRGRVPIHAGSGAGPGLTTRHLGQRAGTEQEILNLTHMPAHNHAMRALDKPGGKANPENAVWAATSSSPAHYAKGSPDLNFDANVMSHTGGGQAHTNLMPFQCISFIIALFGTYPSRT